MQIINHKQHPQIYLNFLFLMQKAHLILLIIIPLKIDCVDSTTINKIKEFNRISSLIQLSYQNLCNRYGFKSIKIIKVLLILSFLQCYIDLVDF